MQQVRVVLGDGAPLLLASVVGALTVPTSSLVVVGCATTVPDLLARVAAEQPDAVVVDPYHWSFPIAELLTAVRQAAPESRTALLGGRWEAEELVDAVRLGASLVSRTRDGDQLVAAVEAVAVGNRVLDVQRVADFSPDGAPEALTDRERAVLRGAANGQRASDTGRELHLAEATIKAHLASASRKLGARTKTHAAVLATNLGLLDAAPLLRELQRFIE